MNGSLLKSPIARRCIGDGVDEPLSLIYRFTPMTQMSIDQAMELAKRHHQARQLAEAAAIYERVLAVAPQHVEALQLLGLVALDLNRPDVASDLFRRGLAIMPNSAELHYNLGVASMFLKQMESAAEAFRRTIALRPDIALAHGNLGAALVSLGRHDDAIAAAKAALAIHPNHPDSYNNLGVALKETNRLDEAAAAFERATQIDPRFSSAWTNLAATLQKMNRPGLSAPAYRQAIKLSPNDPELHQNLGRVLADDRQLDPARQALEAAIRLKPDYPDAYTNLANVLHGLGQYEPAIAAARQAIKLKPDVPLPQYNLSLMLLTRGEFEEGWRLHETRFDVPQLDMKRHNQGRPIWDGSDLHGKTILLNSEQGCGDTIQCMRYIPLIQQRGGRIIIGCHKDLARLLQRFPGIDRVISDIDPSLDFDVSSTMLSLPYLFQTTLQNLPATVPYLQADPADVTKWKARLASIPGQKIGIVWAGRPGHNNDHNRSMKLADFAPLGKVAGAAFITLQKGAAAEQAKDPPAGLNLLDWSTDLSDFADTAALIENLDLVLTVDTSVAHLAGALGKPVWVLLPFVPDWRWMLERTDSPWYPTMRLFRQPRYGDWQAVIRGVAAELGRSGTGVG